MKATKSLSRDVRRKVSTVVFALVLVFSMAIASVALARLDQFGGAPVATVETPYAPYTAGPVVAEEPYAPYTAGPVVREIPPYAPYTAGPVVEEEPYAPYTAGPVVDEVPKVDTPQHLAR